MRYRIKHPFSSPPSQVLQMMFSKDIVAKLAPHMTKILEMEPLSHQDDAHTITRKTRYLPVLGIRSVAGQTIPSRWLEWREESILDWKKQLVRYKNIATTPTISPLLFNQGTMSFEHRLQGCNRIIEGELKLNIPVLGRIAQGLIFRFAREILDEEAKVMEMLLQGSIL